MVFMESNSREIDKSFTSVKIIDGNDREMLFALREWLNSFIPLYSTLFDSGG